MTDSRRIRVAIGNSDYTLRGEASEEHLRRVARTVNDMMRDLIAVNRRLDDRRAAVLTAVNLADELLRIRDELPRVQDGLLRVQDELLRVREERNILQRQYDELLALLDERTQRARPSS